MNASHDKMEPENVTLINCENPECKKSFSISEIKLHLSRNPGCKSKYTSEKYSELEKLCTAHRKKKLHENYEARKAPNTKNLQVGELNNSFVKPHIFVFFNLLKSR